MTPEPGRRLVSSVPFAVVLPALATLVLVVVAAFWVVLPDVTRALVETKRSEIRELTASVTSLLDALAADVQAGRLGREAAQAEAVRRLRLIRYGAEKKDYFFVLALDGKLVLHPYRPDLEGTDVRGWTDPTGKRLFADMIALVEHDASGYLEYQWQHKDERDRVVPKLTHVARFEPWGWIVGTGVYLDELDAEVARLTSNLTRAILAILAVVALLSAVLVANASRVEGARQRAATDLGASEARYRLVAENIGDIVWTTDSQLRLSFVSPSIARVAGWDAREALRLDLAALLPADVLGDALPLWREALAAPGAFAGRSPEARRRSWTFESRLARKGGGETWVETNVGFLLDAAGAPVGLLGTSRDIERRKTAELERNRLEAELLHARKMEALGTLASGIAHDFNNVLATILSATELAAAHSGPAAGELRVVTQAAHRARDLVRQILTFGKRIDRPRRVTALAPVVEEVAALVRPSLAPGQRLDVRLEPGCRPVLADPTQLHQVVMNLATNARQALDGRAGTVTVSLEPGAPDDPVRGRFPDLADETLVCLTVADTGCGMRDEVRARIFDPFFTTKPLGQGTGLGLSVVHGIVTGHGGRVEVESELGRGSTFRVWLPGSGEAAVETSAAPGEPQRGTERVLFVDDEPTAVRFLAPQLEELGYRVTADTDPLAALARFRESAAAFDLVVTDQLMPGMAGVELLRELRAIRPDLRAILMTGGTREELGEAEARALGIREVLLKPMTLAELTAAIRRALAGPAG